ncbi:hypothetical protein M3Y96_00401400 [Aphelenchoides besseyi]|nr:hypothetical protein M3Y96_00401400 [Aphelenchoides besseyi]
METVCVSPCGCYFWSLGITTQIRAYDPEPLFFRQVEIRTLAYEYFETSDITFADELHTAIRSARFQHTTSGTFLFFNMM